MSSWREEMMIYTPNFLPLFFFIELWLDSLDKMHQMTEGNCPKAKVGWVERRGTFIISVQVSSSAAEGDI